MNIDQHTPLTLAAEDHDIVNGVGGWFDSVGESISNIPKFTALSVASGINQFYNSGVSVANWFGANAQENNLADMVTEFDSDLGAYYRKEQDGIDIAGFIGSSLIPGIAGVKVLNYGQKALQAASATGKIGRGMSLTTGILAPNRVKLTAAAVAEMKQSQTVFKLMNTNAVKAIAAGAHQGVLEGVAAEIFVQTALNASPVLDDQSAWDVAKNVALGGIFGGAVEGVIGGVKTTYAMKKGIIDESIRRLPFMSRFMPHEGSSPMEKIILMADDRDNPFVTPTSAIDEGLLASRRTRADNAIREAIHEMSLHPKDVGFSNHFADSIIHSDSKTIAENMGNAYTFGKAHEILPHEEALLKAIAERDKNPPTGTLTFKTAKGSTYTVEGTTTSRVKVDNSKGDAGPKARSTKTFYVDDLGAGQLGEITAIANTGLQRTIEDVPGMANTVAVKYNAGKDAGKFEKRTVTKYQSSPQVGLTPVEIWADGSFHFGNKITEISRQHAPVAPTGYVRFVNLESGNVTSSLDGIFLTGADMPATALAQKLNPFKLVENRETGARDMATVWSQLGLKPKFKKVVQEWDIPHMESALRLGKWQDLKIGNNTGNYLTFSSEKQLQDHIIYEKNALIEKLIQWTGPNGEKYTQQQIAKAANVSEKFLAGADLPPELAYFGDIARRVELNASREARGMKPFSGNIWEVPEYTKMGYTIPDTPLAGEQDLLTHLKQKQVAYQDAANNVIAAHVPPSILSNIPDIPEKLMRMVHSGSVGPGVASFADPTYNSPEAMMKLIGQSVTSPLKEHFRKVVRDFLQTPLLKGIAKPEAMIEFSVVNEKAAQYAGSLFLRDLDDGTVALVKGLEKGAAEGAEEEVFHVFKNSETADIVRQHISLNDARNRTYADISGVNGVSRKIVGGKFHPVKPDPRDYPHVAFVIDPKVAEGLPGHKSMIFGATEKELADLMNRVPPEFKKITKKETEDFRKAARTFNYEDSITENFLDRDLKSKGIWSRFFPQTDPEKIGNDILNYHLRNEDARAVELVRTKYAKEFSSLEDLGESYTRFEASKIGSNLSKLEATGKNPYLNYMKLALDIKRQDELQGFQNFSKLLDKHFSKIVTTLRGMQATTPGDLDKINAYLQESGYHKTIYDASLAALANHSAPKGELTRFVARGNALLSKFTLGLDPLNALNNTIGANVLRNTELSRALRELAPVNVPGTDSTMGSIYKLQARAYSDFFKDMEKGELRSFYKGIGTIKNMDDQFKAILDDFTLHGTENVRELESRMEKLLKRGEIYTGNAHAEEFNRFVSSRVAHLLGEKLGYNHEELRSLITTFVGKVEGNILASQRPLMFQGPIGKAVSLFQSYQLNLMQQLFRYIGEGTLKDAAMLLGLQSSLYGMQGLPAFQLINQHLIGNASGNTEHRDLYDASVSVLGKNAAEFMLYGAPSWFLDTNLYSRGDINPRHPTIIPTNVEDIPVVAMTGKFLGSLFEGAGNIAKGVPVHSSIINALEHNGINRPLGGLATILQGHSTFNNGKIMAENDLFSFATLSRIAGGRPMDEAVVNDSLYRMKAYQAKDREKMMSLNESVRLMIQAGEIPEGDEYAKLANMYAASGGKQDQFAKYMLDMYKTANVPESWKMAEKLHNPLTQKVQSWMND